MSGKLHTPPGFWKGFRAPFEAVNLIVRSPVMLGLILVPLALNVGLYVLFFKFGNDLLQSTVASWTATLTARLPQWTWLVAAANWGLHMIGWLMLAMLAMFSFTIVSGIVLAPFNDHLSKAAVKAFFKRRGLARQQIPGEVSLSVGQTITLELKRTTILILGALLATAVGVIPLLQFPALMIGAWLVAFEYFGYPIGRQTPKLATVGWFTVKHPLVSLGFGSFLLLLMAIPFAAIVYIPLAVVGGTLLYLEIEILKLSQE